MIRLKVAACILVAGLFTALGFPASAQDRVAIGTQRLTDNGALFLAAAEGYFRAEGIELGMTAYNSTRPSLNRSQPAPPISVSRASPAGCIQFRRQRRDQGNRGANARETLLRRQRSRRFQCRLCQRPAEARRPRQQNGCRRSGAWLSFYQLEQIARIKKFEIKSVTVKPMPSLDALARAVGTDEVDAAIMPAQYARELLSANRAKLVGWYSEIDDLQFGALFVSTKMIATKRAMVEKFVRAYRRGAADYAAALLRKEITFKRVLRPPVARSRHKDRALCLSGPRRRRGHGRRRAPTSWNRRRSSILPTSNGRLPGTKSAG